jgi:hypothetical protein
MTEAKAWATHSQPELLTLYDVTGSKQIVPHRGMPDYARGIPDGSMGALLTATSGTSEGGNLAELDVLWIKEKPFVMHDLTGVRQTLYEGPWSTFSLQPWEKMPHFIIRDVEGAKYTEKHIMTNYVVTDLLSSLREILKQNPKATLFLDARNEDGAKVTAYLSHHSTFTNNVLIQIYPYTNRSGEEFVRLVEALDPEVSWKQKISIVPVLSADMLPRLAGVGRNSLDYQRLFEAGDSYHYF